MRKKGVEFAYLHTFTYDDHPYMTIFYSDDCAGYTGMFYYNESVGGGSTQFTAHDLEERFLGEDMGGSVMVPAGYQVDLYSDENLKGSHQRVYGLYNDDGSMSCVKLNDSI